VHECATHNDVNKDNESASLGNSHQANQAASKTIIVQLKS